MHPLNMPLDNVDINGQGGIRTHDDPKAILVFETSAFNRSATCPKAYTQYAVKADSSTGTTIVTP